MAPEPGFPDYTTIAELPGQGASSEQLSMLYTRYAFAASHAAHQRVLDVACGAGLGLGYLAGRCRHVVGGDCTSSLLAEAKRTYGRAVPLVQLDAQALPFRHESVDVVLLYEALYYLMRPEAFLQECRRVLSARGLLILSTVNKEWTDFNPSPFHRRYFSCGELQDLLREQKFAAEMFGAFPDEKHSARDYLVSSIKRLAVKGRLIPSTMQGKLWLKRLVFGRLVSIPPVLAEGLAAYREPVAIPTNRPAGRYKTLFAVARPL
jgi:ubiquinone/menaquinone biosynthesis C-methylase UbiE